MDDKHLTFTVTGDHVDEIAQEFVAVLVINTDTGFHRYRNRYHIAHRFDAISDQLRISHQTGTKHSILYTIGRATHVEVNFVIAPLFSKLCALRQRSRIAPAQLQSDRMFFFAIRQIIAFTMNDRAGGYHLRVEQRLAGQ